MNPTAEPEMSPFKCFLTFVFLLHLLLISLEMDWESLLKSEAEKTSFQQHRHHCGWHDLIVKLTYEQTLHSSSGHYKSSSADFLLPVFISGLFPFIFISLTQFQHNNQRPLEKEREINVIACPTLDPEERSWMKQLCCFVCICDQKTELIMQRSVCYTVASLADLKHHADGIGNI